MIAESRSLFGRLDRPAAAVLFAGLGGACEGIKQALGVSPIVAVNHCEHAIRLHKLNHPETMHFQEDVLSVEPQKAARGRKIRLLWLSPDCTHFSRAKGGKPRETGRRSLAWIAVDWARDVRPEVIILENVQEFLTWGPLDEDGQPIKAEAGIYFQEWLEALQKLGYLAEWRILSAADYGAPTSRRRLFFVARRDGRPFTWPAPTHGPGRAAPWRTAAECIDWSIPCPSIFDRPRPLAHATERRIAEGIRRFVLNSPRPFIVNLTHGGRLEGAVDDPVRTITTAKRGEKAVVMPFLTRYHGEKRPGEAARIESLEAPIPTVTTENRFGLIAAHLTAFYGTGIGSSVDAPCPTVTAGGGRGNSHIGLVSAFLAKHYTGATGSEMGDPIGTITTVDHHSLCTVELSTEEQAGAERVAAFLIKYYGSGGQWQSPDQPLDTVVTKARFGLATIHIQGQPYVITDIGMRMLQPRELARAMGFPEAYQLEGSKADQVARIGNAVCPPIARAIVESMIGKGL